MNEEEKKAIEYSKNCLMKITLGIDCEFDVNILDTLLNIIKKLQKENEEYKKAVNVVNKEKEDWIRAYQEEKDKQFDLINKTFQKVKELKKIEN